MGVSWPNCCACNWSREVPAKTSEPWVCLGCDWVRKTELVRKWSPPISGGGERLGHAHVGVADDGQVLAVRLERAQGAGAEVEVAPGLGRGPQVLGASPRVGAGRSVHHLDGDETGRVEGGGGGRRDPSRGTHRVQERQGQGRGPDVTEERPARKVLSSDEHESVSRACLSRLLNVPPVKSPPTSPSLLHDRARLAGAGRFRPLHR